MPRADFSECWARDMELTEARFTLDPIMKETDIVASHMMACPDC